MRRQELFIFIGVIGFVAVIFFIYLMVSIFTSPTPGQPSPLPINSNQPRPLDNLPSLPPTQPSPSPLPQITGEPTKDGLINLLPIKFDLFDIEYLSGNDTFVVTIKKNPYLENQNKARQWFEDQGFNPDVLKIYWQAFPEVEK